MIEIKSKLRRWGRSFGVVIPMDKIKKEKLVEDEEIVLLVGKKKNPLKETFGTAKFKRPIKEILKEGDRESWDE